LRKKKQIKSLITTSVPNCLHVNVRYSFTTTKTHISCQFCFEFFFMKHL